MQPVYLKVKVFHRPPIYDTLVMDIEPFKNLIVYVSGPSTYYSIVHNTVAELNIKGVVAISSIQHSQQLLNVCDAFWVLDYHKWTWWKSEKVVTDLNVIRKMYGKPWGILTYPTFTLEEVRYKSKVLAKHKRRVTLN